MGCQAALVDRKHSAREGGTSLLKGKEEIPSCTL